MLSATATAPSVGQYYFVDSSRMENFAENSPLKKRVFSDIAPIYEMQKSRKVDLKQVLNLSNQFFQELVTKKAIVNIIPIKALLQYFIISARELLKHSPSYISVEITSAKSLYLFAKVGSHNIYLESFFDEQTGKYIETVVNVFENKNHKLANNGNIADMVKEMGEIFVPIEKDYFDFFSNGYAIPQNSTSSTWL